MGANTTATPHRHVLHDYQRFHAPKMLYGADASVPPMECPGFGYLPVALRDGDDLLVKMWHCPSLGETLISPQTICDDERNVYTGFTIDCPRHPPYHLVFHSDDRQQQAVVPMFKENNLYFLRIDCPQAHTLRKTSPILQAELWHQRLGHTGHYQLKHLPKCSTGIPQSVSANIHPFQQCTICEHARHRANPKGDTTDVSQLVAGQRFHVDFGFMRASSVSYKPVYTKRGRIDSTQRVVQSLDGHVAYLIIVDAVSRYTWVFPTKSKHPPITIITVFLKQFGVPSGYRALRVDQGGEVYASAAFRAAVSQFGYVLEPTGSGCPWMNGKVERLNNTFGVMVRSMLYSAGLSPKFWSFALVYATYIKNRLWHASIKRTPFEEHHGVPPDVSHLRVFGSKITARIPGAPLAKLDDHVYDGVFLGFGATSSLAVYYDIHTGRIKTAGNFRIDEAHFHSSKRPPGAQFLFELGLQDSLPTFDGHAPATVAPALQPPLPKSLPKVHHDGCRVPLPIGEFLSMAPTASAASLVHDPSARDVMSIAMSTDPFTPAFDQVVPVKGDSATLGFIFKFDENRGRLQLTNCEKGQPAHRISRWRSRLRFAYLLAINGVAVRTQKDVNAVLNGVRDRHDDECTFTFTFDEVRNNLTDDGLPQLYFDQLRDIRAHIKRIRPQAYKATIQEKLTRRVLLRRDDWPEWQQAEFKQLDQYESQGMFGVPCAPPSDAAVFHWVWVYVIKIHEGHRKKARAVCDGSTRGGNAKIFGHTYAATPELTDMRLFIALSTLRGFIVFGADVSNAFAEAPASKQQYFMHVDQPFRDWWSHKGRTPIPHGYVVPVLKNLQGHPEAPRQWSNHCDRILKSLGFTSTTHAPCIYRGEVLHEPVLFLRLVDDFAIGTTHKHVYDFICDKFDAVLLEPITRHGILSIYNGINIRQSCDYTQLSVTSYIESILDGHGWNSMKTTEKLPMKHDNNYIRMLDKAVPPETDDERYRLQRQEFNYRQAVGELVWAMVTCRPDISFPVVKLSQFANNPALEHYKAVKQVFRYLSSTRQYAITYWRQQPTPSLPFHPLPRPLAPVDASYHDVSQRETISAFALYGYVDADWAMDLRHRRSISGIVFLFGGAAISWKTRVQPTVSVSTTEAEFLAANDAAKVSLYLRSVLDELEVPQQFATIIFEDNRGARMLSEAAQPTRNSRHIDIRTLATQDWVEKDLIALTDVPSHHNAGDTFTKQNGPLLFVRHVDVTMGRLRAFYLR
mmetsp:Transcript_12630/g.36754  ORF Transcript_12630/g.36754 Transcript_12630/m.36754 type:complete len:1246 (+) Transcript_12630:2039-5776(+)